MATRTELVQGTLDLLVLKALAWGPRHGYGVAHWIQQVTEDALRIEEGSLYPALQRLEGRGLVASEWGTSANNRRAKFYHLTGQGRRRLQAESSSWTRYAEAVAKVLHARPRPA